ncbi:hypothetical protein B0E38_01819 [Streptomyces sp. 111WW2]|uniref:hypothetical protein n=1 Tax=Streptomyces sp. 111WW2 TaxID=1945515 RepID=UPI000D0C7840|nr:hypothetical protein [Streptomyces sp. 111WW2]PSK57974.1 hypothetical protein B0E38_01819 [Streptomyces sp. 111WW2]
MTRPPRRPAEPRPDEVEVNAAAANVTAEWCNSCKAYTLLAGEIVLIIQDGVVTVGYWAWCETCDPPEEAADAA